jgi:hypothetical protein
LPTLCELEALRKTLSVWGVPASSVSEGGKNDSPRPLEAVPLKDTVSLPLAFGKGVIVRTMKLVLAPGVRTARAVFASRVNPKPACDGWVETVEVEDVDVVMLLVDVVTLLPLVVLLLLLVELEVVVVEVDCSGIELVVVLVFGLELESAKYAPAPTMIITTTATATIVEVPIPARVFMRLSPVQNFGSRLWRSVQRNRGVAPFGRILLVPCPQRLREP